MAKNYMQAHKWYNLSTASGCEVAEANRDSLAANMTSTQIAETQRLASAWVKK